MIKNKAALGALLLLTVAVATPAHADEGERGDWEVDFFLGAALLDDYDNNDPALSPDDGFNPEDAPIYGIRIGYFFTPHWNLEGQLQILSTKSNFDTFTGDARVNTELNSFTMNMGYSFLQDRTVRPYVSLGLGVEQTNIDTVMEELSGSLNFATGVRWFIMQRFGLRWDARFVGVDVPKPVGQRQENIESSLALSWVFGGDPPVDTDGDGVLDRKDKCDFTPVGALVDAGGCAVDSDGDQVPDGVDRCPGSPAGSRVDGSGCPPDFDRDGVADGLDECRDTPLGAEVGTSGCPRDSDGDGRYDGLDRCPDTPLGARTDNLGCPRDLDRDGVYDGLDRCPDTPKDGIVGETGCPPDTDRDGIIDRTDRCPDTEPGTRVDARGCPSPLGLGEALILDGVSFAEGSDRVTAGSEEFLNDVAEAFFLWSEMRLEVAGYTDSTGDPDENRALSQRRAEAVRDYLVRRGIDAARFTAVGYGSEDPIGDNSTPEGRARNRRVEIHRLN